MAGVGEVLGGVLSAANPFKTAGDAVKGVTQVLGTLVDRLVPDKAEAARLQAQLALADQAMDAVALQGQIQANVAQAQSANWFVAGGRPALIWCCALFLLALLVMYVIWPPIAEATGTMAPSAPADGVLDLFLYLTFGLAGLRTVDKVAGVASRGIAKVKVKPAP